MPKQINLSPDVTWSIIKNNSSFLVKRRHTSPYCCFTKEPMNLLKKNAFKYSGLANPKAIGVELEKGRMIITKKRNCQNLQKAQKITVKSRNLLHIGQKKKKQMLDAANTLNPYYREDLSHLLKARVAAVRRASVPMKYRKAATSNPHYNSRQRNSTSIVKESEE